MCGASRGKAVDVSERPILMSAPMVRAILAGTKTQTRRIWKMPRGLEWYTSGTLRGMETGDIHDPLGPWWGHVSEVRCPHGRPDDRLWVREEHYCFGHWEPVPGMKTKAGRMKWRFVQDTGEVLHAPPQSFRLGRHHKDPAAPAWHKRLARFMPRRYARITLEIADVRVERLQEITEADARAEGVDYDPGEGGTFWVPGAGCTSDSAVDACRKLFESINGPGPWDANPWVWVIGFRRLDGRAHNEFTSQ